MMCTVVVTGEGVDEGGAAPEEVEAGAVDVGVEAAAGEPV